jgi:hypothetical protein
MTEKEKPKNVCVHRHPLWNSGISQTILIQNKNYV